MTDRATSLLAVGAALVFGLVIVVGLATGPSEPATAADRVAALSAAIKCPFCAGESLADSSSAVAADYRTLIEQYVEEGWTDEMIRTEFARNFGDSVILDGSTSSWFLALWILPLIGFAIGVWAIVSMRRSSNRSEERADAH